MPITVRENRHYRALVRVDERGEVLETICLYRKKAQDILLCCVGIMQTRGRLGMITQFLNQTLAGHDPKRRRAKSQRSQLYFGRTKQYVIGGYSVFTLYVRDYIHSSAQYQRFSILGAPRHGNIYCNAKQRNLLARNEWLHPRARVPRPLWANKITSFHKD